MYKRVNSETKDSKRYKSSEVKPFQTYWVLPNDHLAVLLCHFSKLMPEILKAQKYWVP